MRRSLAALLGIGLLALSGCTPMEHKSDLPDKTPLGYIDTSVEVTKQWTVSTGRGAGRKDIRLLLAQSGDSLITVDYKGHLQAINAKTGEKQWQLELNAPISSGPGIGQGKIVVGTNNGKVIAVDLATHTWAWTSTATSEILAAPKIADNMVFVHCMDGSLSAYSLSDGRQLWRFTHNLPPLVLRSSSAPAVTKDLVLAGFSTGKLLGVKINDGSVVWTQDIGHPKGRTDLQRMVDISADPVVKDNVVYAASYQGNLAAVEVENGRLIWDRDISSYSGFIVADNNIYLSSTNGDIYAVERSTGQVIWKQTELHGRRLTKPSLMTKYVVVADEDGYVHWLNKQNGKLVGRFAFDKKGVEAAPVVNNNIVYILGRGGKLVAVEVK